MTVGKNIDLVTKRDLHLVRHGFVKLSLHCRKRFVASSGRRNKATKGVVRARRASNRITKGEKRSIRTGGSSGEAL